MTLITYLIQGIVPLVIINVWLFRSKRSTAYRGKSAPNLKEEFAAYGLPTWFYYTVGVLKLSAAAMLLIGFLIPALVFPGSALMAALMLGAVVMHAKVGDPAIRYMPAVVMLIMSLALLF